MRSGAVFDFSASRAGFSCVVPVQRNLPPAVNNAVRCGGGAVTCDSCDRFFARAN